MVCDWLEPCIDLSLGRGRSILEIVMIVATLACENW